ncbi:MAG: 6-phosphofructokinase [Nitrospinae bacterium]|nr:6-phosphofructokinase [Nitrospinota bacterium]
MAENKKVLLVFDGGNAPGYTAVATSLTEEGDKRGYKVYAAFEGFRSLTGDHNAEERLIRLVMSRRTSWKLNAKGIPTRSLYRAVDQPGCEFRSERFPEFIKPEKQKSAAEYIGEMEFSHVIGVGGNGTLMGIKALNELLPDAQTGFINVSVDSDIKGDIAVGYLTGAEEGAKIARGLFDDAYTHKRIYILEMMGRDSGKHALMSGASARAHLIVLPGFKLPDAILGDIAGKLAENDHALIVVAEGYEREERAKFLPERVDAAMYFKRQLVNHGLSETPTRRIITEPFSRYLRGIRPLYLECAIAFLKAFNLFDAFEKGQTRVMPYYLGEHDHGIRGFDELETANQVDPRLLDLIDRMAIPSLRKYVAGEFRG